ncbi:MAG TPA: thioredoxin domain-containing protein [Longimicrobium sp.]|jgi:protein-disulfide isomerase
MKNTLRNRARTRLHLFNASIGVLTVVGLAAIFSGALRAERGFRVGPSGMNLKELAGNAGMTSGADSAPVVVRVFGAYHCPHCGSFELAAGARLREMAAQGKIRYVFIHGSRDMTSRNRNGAAAAYCADEQDRGSEMRDVLYRTWSEWGRGEDPAPKIAAYAAALGIDGTRFRACVGSPRTLGLVRRDRNAAERVGIERVPTVFVNDDRVQLAGAYGPLIQLVEERVRGSSVATRAARD